jgi:hypothetical protein
MALKGLNKGDRAAHEERAEVFIKGATERVLSHRYKENHRVFERYTFSLTAEISQKIDQLSLIPRTFRASRSDVIKAGVELLSTLSDQELSELIAKVK